MGVTVVVAGADLVPPTGVTVVVLLEEGDVVVSTGVAALVPAGLLLTSVLVGVTVPLLLAGAVLGVCANDKELTISTAAALAAAHLISFFIILPPSVNMRNDPHT